MTQNSSRKEKHPYLNEKANSSPACLIIDGLWGSGKSLVAPALGRLDKVGPFRIGGTIESLTQLLRLKMVSTDTARTLASNHISDRFTANLLGRELNLRPSDDSFYFKTGGTFADLGRALARESSQAQFQKHVQEGYRYFEMTHMALAASEYLPEILPSGSKILVVRRDPLSLVSHTHSYVKSTLGSAKDMTITTLENGEAVPSIAQEWVDDWLESNLMERSALLVARCSQNQDYAIRAISKAAEPSSPVMATNFEDYLASPARELRFIATWLDVGVSRSAMSYARRSTSRPTLKPRPENSPDYRNSIIEELRYFCKPRVLEELVQSSEVYHRKDLT